MELIGKNPIIIMEDADLGLALDGVIWGAFGTTGQRCTAASRFIDVGFLVNEAALKKTASYVEIGKQEGAKLCCGGHGLQKGYFFKPTVFEVTPDMRISKEEVFGPVLVVLELETLEEAIELLETGLTYVNASTIGSEVHLPFGGVKKTGYTREGGY